jgi:hypothetical protein
MGRRRIEWTPELIKRRIAEGRGQGEGPNYDPWHRVQDFPSLGRVHRIFGWKTCRVHHLLSDLELKVFLHFQWPRSVTEQREQFALLPLEETLEIARDIGVRHPADPRTKCPVVMSTDLVLTIDQGLKMPLHPCTVKYYQALDNPRTREKLEIERRYWAAPTRNSTLKIYTERQVSDEFVKNMLWVYPCYWLTDLYPLTGPDVKRIATLLTHMALNDNLPIRRVTQRCDRILRLDVGTSLAVVRHLIANRFWEVDVSKRIRTNERLILLNPPRRIQYDVGRLVA